MSMGHESYGVPPNRLRGAGFGLPTMAIDRNPGNALE